MWLMFAFGSALFAGATAILSKIGIRDTDSNLATALRTIVVLIFSWLMVFIVGSQNSISDINPRSMAFLILSGFAAGASWLCYFGALQRGDVNKVTPIDKSSTVLTMVLAFIFLNEGFTYIKALCIVLIGVGTYMMIEKKDSHNTSNSGWFTLALLSTVFAALTSILGKIGIQGIESNLGTAIRTIVVLIMSWVVVFVTKKQGEIKNISIKSGIFLILSGCATGASWLCYYRALQIGQASIVVPIDKLSIIITILFSRIVLKERLNKKSFAGLILIVAGTLLLLIK